MDDILGIICARKGSKRLPGKNEKVIDGISLTERSLQTLHAAGIEQLVVATDFMLDFDIQKYGATHLFRPENISEDNVPLQETIKWVYYSMQKDYKYVVYLMPNCPMISVEIVKKAIKMLTEGRFNVIRSYNGQGDENGMIAVRTKYLMDHFIDVYCGGIVCPGDEIHDERDYLSVKKIMEGPSDQLDK
ncbi:hypothetical protein LCGC14_1932900 [marine sediment metagenome]|uniref:CMP-N-acetylneuraminic acid synthetase n=1 Tax=marine sediment metagenome TaxID=412755 RepID=A0A0F9I1A1_9ZZZZ|nr:hypothetical protein [Phycisphaerales bacterium]